MIAQALVIALIAGSIASWLRSTLPKGVEILPVLLGYFAIRDLCPFAAAQQPHIFSWDMKYLAVYLVSYIFSAYVIHVVTLKIRSSRV